MTGFLGTIVERERKEQLVDILPVARADCLLLRHSHHLAVSIVPFRREAIAYLATRSHQPGLIFSVRPARSITSKRPPSASPRCRMRPETCTACAEARELRGLEDPRRPPRQSYGRETKRPNDRSSSRRQKDRSGLDHTEGNGCERATLIRRRRRLFLAPPLETHYYVRTGDL